jgi:uncharacterized protein (DUF488 family)
MRPLITALLVLVAARAFPQDQNSLVDPVAQKALADSLRSVLRPDSRVFLYAMDSRLPRGRASKRTEMFQDYRVLGRAEIKDAAENQALLDALAEGITSSNGVIAYCFEPRHALRVETADARVDLNICFECLQIFPHGFNGNRSIPVTRGPEAVFDAALKKHGLQKSKA